MHDVRRTGASNSSLAWAWPTILTALAVAAADTLLHRQIVDGPNLAEQMRWHADILRGAGPYPDQYRILSYALAQGLISAGIPFAFAHEAVRLVCTAASFVLFVRYLEQWFRPATAWTGLFLLAATVPLTYLFYAMQPTDPLNLLVFVAAFLALQRRRDGWMIPLVVVGMLNRETAVLLPVLHALVRWRTPDAPRRWAIVCAIEGVLAVGIYVGLRSWYGLRPPYDPRTIQDFLAINLFDWRGWLLFVGVFHAALWLGGRNFSRRPLFLRRAAWLAVPFLAIHVSVGLIREVRYFLPLLPISIPFVLFAVEEWGEGLNAAADVSTPG